MNIFRKFQDFVTENKQDTAVYELTDKSKQFLLQRTADDLKAIAEGLRIDDEININELNQVIETIRSIRGSVKKVNEQNYSKGCVMAITEDINKEYPEIPEEELYTENDGKDFGRETEPHVTALYGLESDQIEESEVKEIIEKYKDVSIKLTDISKFESEKYDVLKFGVDSDSLREMNKDLSELPHSTDYPDYKPHLTIAYMKKGEADKYLREFKEPIEVKCTAFEYSKPGDSEDPKRKTVYKI